MTRLRDLDRDFRNATDEELEQWQYLGKIDDSGKLVMKSDCGEVICTITVDGPLYAGPVETQEYSLAREGLLVRYEGPIFVAAFIAACLGFLSWLMLSDGWKAVIFWCAIVAFCSGMIAWKIIRDRS